MGTSTTTTAPRVDDPKRQEEGGLTLIDVQEVDRMFPAAIAATCFLWVFLLLLVYSLVPPEDYVYLDGPEREAAAAACYIFIVSTGLSLIPLYVQRLSGENSAVSGVIWALISVQFIAMVTNGLLAWAPTVVMIDKVTHARVYLVRWCEWIPTAFLMTFLSEIVDCHSGLYGVLVPVLVSLGQTLSCLMALIFPFCPTLRSWLLTCSLAVILWATIFPRLYHKYSVYKNTKRGISMLEMERSCRVKFGYHLLFACATLWSVLVGLYFFNFASFHYFPDAYFVKNEALPMILDTLFDVCAKALYMRLIVAVHQTVFDAEGRANRQLDELKRMISVLWESSSDVIVISVRNGTSTSTMISPTFPSMIGVSVSVGASGVGSALMVKSEELPVAKVDEDDTTGAQEKAKIRTKSSSFFVDTTEMPYYEAAGQSVHLPDTQIDDLVNGQADCLVQAAWNGFDSTSGGRTTTKAGKREDSLVVLDLHKTDGSLIKCELKVSRHSNNAVIAIVRDVTERYMRFDAERRAHTESLARQKDAQAVNRFTRHEIKNGLLAGIELCQEVSKHVGIIKGSLKSLTSESDDKGTAKCISELDSTLHDVLDTVLAEAMAREIVHESYKPKLERVDLQEILSSKSGLQDESTTSLRFPLHICPENTPHMSMDPQLLKYIHRNAVSNACKYGLKGGKVTTEVHYFEKKGEFEMDVINEPGPWNDKLVLMGDLASETVFAQGQRLSVHLEGDDTENHISTGDGAWIMMRCAKTMGGLCSIRFDPHQTVFSFRCKVEPYTLPWEENKEFQVPSHTWGIGFDDSAIQRKLMKKIFLYAGVDEARIVVKGKNESEIKKLDGLLTKILSLNKKGNLLVLMDENLDYENDGVAARLSGSKHAEKVLDQLSPAQRDRVFVLVRSANDSDSDIALYNERTHGFFPKASIRKDRVRELLAPAWMKRFPEQVVPDMITMAAMSALGGQVIPNLITTSEISALDASDIEDKSSSTTEKCSDFDKHSTANKIGNMGNSEDGRANDEIWATVQTLDGFIKSDVEIDWEVTWSKLHQLMGDLIVLEDKKNIELCISLIGAMRGDSRPQNFQEKWERIHTLVLAEVR